ncbi:liver-expressed antimicrobial peptide 2-like [Pseudophryne corroboree]|uniref:liver-expressed antimicrobial peptide 2-like n=1 Tax=Pseudophryne corroboree TaxID=495146 RepID=UPI00308204B9
MVSIDGSLCIVMLLCNTQVFTQPSSIYQGLSPNRYMHVEKSPDWPPASLLRVSRMTPFWRTVGSKPIGAYCQQGLECTTKVCR